MDTKQSLPVAIIGAGPVGLAAAAHLIERGETPLIFEGGGTVGASMMNWGHVRVFTPWRYVTDKAARALLEPLGWRSPTLDSYPTGADIVHDYLIPLASTPQIQPHLHLNTRVINVSRQGFDKMKTDGRENAPFVLTTRAADGTEENYLAKAVIDASGTYQSPNPLGANGVPALGETNLRDHIYYGIPDILGSERARYANRKVLVVGSGHSAFNTILDLIKLAEIAPETSIVWAVRRARIGQMFGGGDTDALSARGALGQRVRALVEAGRIQFVTGFRVARLRRGDGQIEVIGESGTIVTADEIITTTGFRPDLSILSEMRLELDPAVESPTVLAPMIDPNLHSCGTVRPHGAEELKHPEPDFYIIGMKSYGRAPTFLMLTGYEQARSVVAAIVGDWEAARQVQLELPETGVCVSNFDDDGTSAACCGTPRSYEVAVPSQNLIAIGAIPVTANLNVRQPFTANVLQPVGLQTAAAVRDCGCDDTCCADGVQSTTCGCDTNCCS